MRNPRFYDFSFDARQSVRPRRCSKTPVHPLTMNIFSGKKEQLQRKSEFLNKFVRIQMFTADDPLFGEIQDVVIEPIENAMYKIMLENFTVIYLSLSDVSWIEIIDRKMPEPKLIKL